MVYKVYNSVGTGLENNLDVDNMRKILSFSYYDMPSHLRNCLLYLSMFPEDISIDKSHLILLWIAEGFIQGTKPGQSLFELGESYLNELINRSLVQPKYNAYDYMSCRVHDMVLDLLCSLSREENFATTLNDAVDLSPSMKVRRLSLQNSTATDAAALQVASMSMEQVRSVVCQSAFKLLPALSSFRVLRVLDLEECNISEDSSLEKLGNLVHLRYLGLGEIWPRLLPEEISNLRFLQTLVVDYTGNLPSRIGQLKDLICIRVNGKPDVPKGIGNLTSLEELSSIDIDSIEILQEMGNLMELRVLDIGNTDVLVHRSFAEWLCKLRKLERLRITEAEFEDDELILDDWDVAPKHIRALELGNAGFSRLPDWMKPLFLPHLCSLEAYVEELHQEDFKILGDLPALSSLDLRLGHEWAGLPRRFTAAAGSFPCLSYLRMKGYVQPFEFQQGAMPKLETLDSTFLWWEMTQIARNSGGYDLGLRNLSSLKLVTGYVAQRNR